MSYIALVVITLILGFITQGYINASYGKYSKISSGSGMTGADMARKMLADNGVRDVRVLPIAGKLTDNYDPRKKTVNLSEGVYNSTSIAALAVACHECGHAVQHATSYAPLNARTALFPVANFGSSAWLILLMVGVFLNITGLVWAGIIVYAFAVLFQIVTLPVEFNASSRALAYLRTQPSMVAGGGIKGASTMLRAAALTYVAAALTSVMQLLYYVSVFTDRR